MKLKFDKQEEQEENGEINAVLKALASIYTGTFLINLETDRYTKISAIGAILSILDGIPSA